MVTEHMGQRSMSTDVVFILNTCIPTEHLNSVYTMAVCVSDQLFFSVYWFSYSPCESFSTGASILPASGPHDAQLRCVHRYNSFSL